MCLVTSSAPFAKHGYLMPYPFSGRTNGCQGRGVFHRCAQLCSLMKQSVSPLLERKQVIRSPLMIFHYHYLSFKPFFCSTPCNHLMKRCSLGGQGIVPTFCCKPSFCPDPWCNSFNVTMRSIYSLFSGLTQ